MSKFEKQSWINRFLTQEQSPEERSRFQRERSEDIQYDRQVRESEKLWELTGLYKSTSRGDVSGAWAAFEEKAGSSIRPVRRMPWLRIAASFLILFGVALGWYVFLRPPQLTLLAQTAAGEQLELPLPDGSVVWLNELSTLHCLDCQTGFSRELQLNGEAYFQVAHNPARPFKVNGAHTEVQVLGTQFNFRCYSSESMEEVEVNSGRVQVRTTNGSPVILEPEQRLRNYPGKQQVAKGASPHFNGSAWKHGKLNFRGEPIAEVLEYLQRFYSIQIKADANQVVLDTCLFTAQVERTMTLNEIVAVLQSQFDFQLKIVAQGDKKTYQLLNFRCR